MTARHSTFRLSQRSSESESSCRATCSANARAVEFSHCRRASGCVVRGAVPCAAPRPACSAVRDDLISLSLSVMTVSEALGHDTPPRRPRLRSQCKRCKWLFYQATLGRTNACCMAGRSRPRRLRDGLRVDTRRPLRRRTATQRTGMGGGREQQRGERRQGQCPAAVRHARHHSTSDSRHGPTAVQLANGPGAASSARTGQATRTAQCGQPPAGPRRSKCTKSFSLTSILLLVLLK